VSGCVSLGAACVCARRAVQENTLVSFATAAQMGADMIEFDALLTADGCAARV
jgi:glycerophosphoryl diester phosphodiesterase